MAFRTILPILIVTILSIMIGSCHKLCTPHSYRLTGGITTFLADKDSIQIGDTLWFSSSFPVNLKYPNGSGADSNVVDLSGASNVVTDIHFDASPKKDTVTRALDSFLIIPLIGKIEINPLDEHGAETIIFKEQQGNFVASFGIIAQKKGVYYLTVIDIFQAMKNCTKASITLPISSTINQHLNFLDSVYFPGSRYEPSIPIFELTHDYCFKVY